MRSFLSADCSEFPVTLTAFVLRAGQGWSVTIIHVSNRDHSRALIQTTGHGHPVTTKNTATDRAKLPVTTWWSSPCSACICLRDDHRSRLVTKREQGSAGLVTWPSIARRGTLYMDGGHWSFHRVNRGVGKGVVVANVTA